MRLDELTPTRGATSRAKRVGRGIGSGHGKTSCRGSKGQKARGSIRPGFEGGQTPLYMRLRKHRGRGKGAMPQRMFKREHAIMNLGDLQTAAENIGKNPVVTPELLLEHGVLKQLHAGLRVLGEGELTLPITIHAHHFSASALAKIQAAGGRALTLPAGAFAPAPTSSGDNSAEGASGREVN